MYEIPTVRDFQTGRATEIKAIRDALADLRVGTPRQLHRDSPRDSSPLPRHLAVPGSLVRFTVPKILDYLAHRLPGYPFNTSVDRPFIEELLDDFPDVDILEEVKAFRWYHDNQPLARIRSPRVALRRWIANARPG